MRSDSCFIIPDMMASDQRTAPRNSQASALGRSKRTSDKENQIPKLAGGTVRGAKQSASTASLKSRQGISQKGPLAAPAVPAVPDAVMGVHGSSSAVVSKLEQTVGDSRGPISPTYVEAAQRVAHHRWRTVMLAERQQSPLNTDRSNATSKRSTLTDPINILQFETTGERDQPGLNNRWLRSVAATSTYSPTLPRDLLTGR